MFAISKIRNCHSDQEWVSNRMEELTTLRLNLNHIACTVLKFIKVPCLYTLIIKQKNGSLHPVTVASLFGI